jgi:mRNA interferase RelE/StbE
MFLKSSGKMAKYRITIKKSAAKELSDIPKKDLPKIVKRIQTLAQNPRPDGSQKLSGQEQYRIRQGDYRIVYSIEDKDSLVDIFKIGHRREIYRP